jgi:hypothetical protein
MKERPILMNTFSIRGILNGRKTQTRRVVRCDQQFINVDDISEPHEVYVGCGKTIDWFGRPAKNSFRQVPCPYGKPGDRLWVRETWNSDQKYADLRPSMIPRGAQIYYKADGPDKPDPDGIVPIWRPSIHMPRWASRLTLEITDVRVERVQDIAPEDVFAEGIHSVKVGAFMGLWDSIYAERGLSWASNPWVWVIEFALIT